MNSAAKKLIEALKELVGREVSLSAEDIPGTADLDDKEHVNWVSSNWIEPEFLNLFVCSAPDSPDAVVLTRHGDRGILVGIGGPWLSVEGAKAGFGDAPE